MSPINGDSAACAEFPHLLLQGFDGSMRGSELPPQLQDLPLHLPALLLQHAANAEAPEVRDLWQAVAAQCQRLYKVLPGFPLDNVGPTMPSRHQA
jgi:hypothetical protein